MSTLFLLSSLAYYDADEHVETKASIYLRPKPDQTYGCPADADNLWHLECSSGCGSSWRAKGKQGDVDYALGMGYDYIVITSGFYTMYKTEVDDFIKRTGKSVYLLVSRSACSGPDCHCYYISFSIIEEKEEKEGLNTIILICLIIAGLYMLFERRS